MGYYLLRYKQIMLNRTLITQKYEHKSTNGIKSSWKPSAQLKKTQRVKRVGNNLPATL